VSSYVAEGVFLSALTHLCMWRLWHQTWF